MQTMQIQSHIGNDGMLHISLDLMKSYFGS